MAPVMPKKGGDLDFDALLRQTQKLIKKKKEFVLTGQTKPLDCCDRRLRKTKSAGSPVNANSRNVAA